MFNQKWETSEGGDSCGRAPAPPEVSMDIACPSCGTGYEIDESAIAEGGRKVRCASCGTIWRVFRQDAADLRGAARPLAEEVGELAAAPPMAPSEEDVRATGDLPAMTAEEIVEGAADVGGAPPSDEAAQPRGARLVKGARPKTKQRPKVATSTVLSALAVVATVAAGFAAYVWRERVVAALPHSAAVFAVAGAPVNVRGVDIRNVRSLIVEENGMNVLVVDGELVGVAAERRPLPRLRFAVLDDAGREIYVWSAPAERPAVNPGETISFRRRLAAPPAESRQVKVRFLSASDMIAGANRGAD